MRWSMVVAFYAMLGTKQALPGEPPPDLAKAAAHCMITHPALVQHGRRTDQDVIQFGFDLDTESYPGGRAIYAVSYSGKHNRKGLVYVIFEEQNGPSRLLRIENNATFVRRKHGVEYTESPLGGVWTQQHLEAAINRIESRPKTQFTRKELDEDIQNLRCESYLDSN